MKWIKYRFKTPNSNDYRPVVFNESYPWWCTGYRAYDAIIVCYLPDYEDLDSFWPDNFEVEAEKKDGINFTDRFSKPKWYKPLEDE